MLFLRPTVIRGAGTGQAALATTAVPLATSASPEGGTMSSLLDILQKKEPAATH